MSATDPLDDNYAGYGEILERLTAERDALHKLADVTGNYLLYAPREKGHGAAHNRLWDAYREYEAFCNSLEQSA